MASRDPFVSEPIVTTWVFQWGPLEVFQGFQLIAKVVITYLFDLSNSLNNCDYF
jgi:hypothetical protein